VVGLLTTLALMQLFLFSFYLNGLHSEAHIITRQQSSSVLTDYQVLDLLINLPATSVEGDVHQVNEAQPLLQPPSIFEQDKEVQGQPSATPVYEEDQPLSAIGQGQVQPIATSNNQKLVNQLTDLLSDRSRYNAVGDVAKKVFDNVIANKQDALVLMAMATNTAQKMSVSDDFVDNTADQKMLTKIGLNILGNALGNNSNRQIMDKKGFHQTSEDSLPDSKNAYLGLGAIAEKAEEIESKPKYADLAKKACNFLTVE